MRLSIDINDEDLERLARRVSAARSAVATGSDSPPYTPAQSAILLTLADAAARLSISRGSMYDLIRRGLVPSIQIGRLRRVSVAALNDFIAAEQTPTAPPPPPNAARVGRREPLEQSRVVRSVVPTNRRKRPQDPEHLPITSRDRYGLTLDQFLLQLAPRYEVLTERQFHQVCASTTLTRVRQAFASDAFPTSRRTDGTLVAATRDLAVYVHGDAGRHHLFGRSRSEVSSPPGDGHVATSGREDD
jgi:excisionase family DNA binding protein